MDPQAELDRILSDNGTLNTAPVEQQEGVSFSGVSTEPDDLDPEKRLNEILGVKKAADPLSMPFTPVKPGGVYIPSSWKEDIDAAKSDPSKLVPAAPSERRDTPEEAVGKRVGEMPWYKAMFVDPYQAVAREKAVRSVSERMGVPEDTVRKHYHEFMKAQPPKDSEGYLGEHDLYPGYMEDVVSGLMDTGMGVAIAGTVMANPAAIPKVATMIAGFMALGEIGSFVRSEIKDTPYEFGNPWSAKELLPDDADTASRILFDVADFLGKGAVLGGGARIVEPRLKLLDTVVKERYLRDTVREYGLPSTLYVSPEDLRAAVGGAGSVAGEAAAPMRDLSPDLVDFLKTLDFSEPRFRESLNLGMDVVFPTENLVRITDKPWYANLKKVLRVTPYELETRTTTGELTYRPHYPRLTEDAGKARETEAPAGSFFESIPDEVKNMPLGEEGRTVGSFFEDVTGLLGGERGSISNKPLGPEDLARVDRIRQDLDYFAARAKEAGVDLIKVVQGMGIPIPDVQRAISAFQEAQASSLKQYQEVSNVPLTPEGKINTPNHFREQVENKGLQPYTATGKPQRAYFVLGPVASGKTESLGGVEQNAFYIGDADRNRAIHGKETEEAFHKEASRSAKQEITLAAKGGYDFLYQTRGMRPEEILGYIKNVADPNAEIEIFLNFLDAASSRARSDMRYIMGKTDRQVHDKAVLEGTNRGIAGQLELVKRLKDDPRVHFMGFDRTPWFRPGIQFMELRGGQNVNKINEKIFDYWFGKGYISHKKGGELIHELYGKDKYSAADFRTEEMDRLRGGSFVRGINVEHPSLEALAARRPEGHPGYVSGSGTPEGDHRVTLDSILKASGTSVAEIIENADQYDRTAVRGMFSWLEKYVKMATGEISNRDLRALKVQSLRFLENAAELYEEISAIQTEIDGQDVHFTVREDIEGAIVQLELAKTREEIIVAIDRMANLSHTTGLLLPAAAGIGDYGSWEYWPKQVFDALAKPAEPREVVAVGRRLERYGQPTGSFFALLGEAPGEFSQGMHGEDLYRYILVDESKIFKGDNSEQFIQGHIDVYASDPLLRKYKIKNWHELFHDGGAGDIGTAAYQTNPNAYFWIIQKKAEQILKEQGYAGAEWMDEDALTPHQFQIWDQSVLKADPFKIGELIADIRKAEAEFQRLSIDHSPGEAAALDHLRSLLINLGQRIQNDFPFDTPGDSTDQWMKEKGEREYWLWKIHSYLFDTFDRLRSMLEDIWDKVIEPLKNQRGSFSTKMKAADPFYSKLVRVVENPELPKKAQSVVAYLEKKGVKPAEIKWMDIPGWIKKNAKDGVIDRDALRQYVSDNQVHIEELTLGGEDTSLIDYDTVEDLAPAEVSALRGKGWDFGYDDIRGGVLFFKEEGGYLYSDTAEIEDEAVRGMARKIVQAVDRYRQMSAVDQVASRVWSRFEDEIGELEGYGISVVPHPDEVGQVGFMYQDDIYDADYLGDALAEDGVDRDLAFELVERASLIEEGAAAIARVPGGYPKYSDYTLPGGENYREVLFVLKEKAPAGTADQYISSHYEDVPNLIAHIRVNDRIDSTGAKVLFLEELQSDWLQQAKEKGFNDRDEIARLEAEVKRLDALRENPEGLPESVAWLSYMDKLEAKYGSTGFLLKATEKEKTENEKLRKASDDAVERLGSEYQSAADRLREARNGIPPAPFLDNWQDLFARRFLRMAAEEGYKKVAWTTGKQQADRYNLAKYIDEVKTLRLGTDPESYAIRAYKDGREIISRSPVTPGDLPDVIGKDLANKIIKAEKDANEWTGLDLQVGGEGMLVAYDEILTNGLAKAGKPFGAKVGTTKLEVNGEVGETYYGGLDVHSMDLPDSMIKDLVEKGVALWDISMLLNPEAYRQILGPLVDKVEQAIPVLVEMGQRIWEAGEDTEARWLFRMKEALGELWAKFKAEMQRVFDIMRRKILEERGSISEDPLDDIEINRLFKLAGEDVRTIEASLTVDSPMEDIRLVAARKAQEKFQLRVERDQKRLTSDARKSAEAAANEDPLFQLMTDVVQAGGFKKDALLKDYSETTVKELMRKRPGIVTYKGKVFLDEMADAYSHYWETADELMSAMLDAPTKAEIIKREVDAYENYMADRYESDYSALYEQMLDEELAIMRKLTGKYKAQPHLNIKRDIRMNTGMLRVSDFVQGEGKIIFEPDALKASMKAAERASRIAWREGRKDGAIAEKERQRKIADELRARVQTREEIRNIQKGIVRVIKEKPGKSLKPEERANFLDYQDKIRQILEGFDFLPRGAKTQRRIESLEAHLANLANEEDAAEIPLALMRRTVQKPWRELTVEELRDIYDQVQMLRHLRKTKGKLLGKKRERDFNAEVAALVSTIKNNWPKPVKKRADVITFPSERQEGVFDRARQRVANYKAQLLKIETMIKKLDKWKDLGPVWDSLYKPIVDAERLELEQGGKAIKDLMAAFEPFKVHKGGLPGWASEKFTIPGYKRVLSKQDIVMVALNSGNDGNLKTLMSGMGLSLEDITNVLSVLTPAEWKLVEDIWEIVDRPWPDLAAAYKKMTGARLKKVEGKYFPIKLDRQLSAVAEQHAQMQEAKDFFQSIYPVSPTVQLGATKERTGTGLPPLLEFSVILKHIVDVNHYVTHVVAVRDIKKLLSDIRVRNAIEDALGEEAYAEMIPWLQNIAKPQPDAVTALEKGFAFLRKNATIVALGAKFSVALQQPLAITNTMARLGVVDTLGGLGKFWSHPWSAAEFVNAKSPMMVNRWKAWDREVENIQGKLALVKRFKVPPAIVDASFYLISALDMLQAYPTWLAAYKEGMEAKWPGEEEKAIDFADSVVAETQMYIAPKEMPRVMRGSEGLKLFTMFYSFFSACYQMLWTARQRFKVGDIGVVDFAKAWLLIVVIPSIISDIIKERRMLTPKEMIGSVLGYRMAMLPGVRDLASAVFTDFPYQLSPVGSALKETAKAAKPVYDSALHVAGVSRELPNWDRWGKHAVTASGYLVGLPTQQAVITAEGIADLYSGHTKDWSRLFMRESKKEER